MRRLTYILIGLVVAVLSACSNVDEGDRLVYVKPTKVGRKILIEDFTGQRCVNCPRATDEIEHLQEQYGGDTIIAVGIHSGRLGFHGSATVLGLATDEGDEYYNHWRIEYQPQGMVNRQGKADYTSWASLAYDNMAKTAALDIDLSCTTQDKHTANVKVTTLGTDGVVSGKLQVWVIEDGVKALQLMPDGSPNYEYVHNHVFRTSVNGTWGQDFTTQEGQTQDFNFNFELDSKWIPRNISIVAFVYNDSGVLQVSKAPLTIQP